MWPPPYRIPSYYVADNALTVLEGGSINTMTRTTAAVNGTGIQYHGSVGSMG